MERRRLLVEGLYVYADNRSSQATRVRTDMHDEVEIP